MNIHNTVKSCISYFIEVYGPMFVNLDYSSILTTFFAINKNTQDMLQNFAN